MDSQKVDLFLAANQKFFSPTQILSIKDRLLALDELVLEDVVHHQILSPVTHAVYGVVEEDDLPRLVRALEGRA